MAKEDRIETTTGYGKLLILIFGMLVLILGLHSHMQSAWTKYEMHDMCEDDWVKASKKPCPGHSMEKFYVFIIIITYMLSVLNLAATLIRDIRQGVFKLVDLGIHVFSAVFLLLAAIVYMVSAEQIHSLLKSNGFLDSEFLRSEKLAAGSFTIIQAMIYGVTAFFIIKG